MNKAATNKSSDSGMKTIQQENVGVSPPRLRILQNFLVVWLDANMDETKEEFKKNLEQLRSIMASIILFTDVDEYVDFFSEVQEEKVFAIISSSLSRQLIVGIEMNTWPQLHSSYVFCDNQLIDKTWTKTIPRLKGIYTNIKSICEALQTECQQCDRAAIPMTFDRIDPLFMYTQFLKEAFLQIEDDDEKSIHEFAEYCRLKNDISENAISTLQQEYYHHTPIWWYTAPFFIYSMLNHCLRLMDVDTILKIGFFIRHLHNQIQQLHAYQQLNHKDIHTAPFQVYRGQGLSMESFNKIKKSEGKLMSFNNFLSTSRKREVSLLYANSASSDSALIGILFSMIVDPEICRQSSTHFIDVKDVGYFQNTEEEILFTPHTVFRIEKVELLPNPDMNTIWQVNLVLCNNDNHDLNSVASSLREEISLAKGYCRLGYILLKIGKPQKAEHLFTMMLEQATNGEEKAQHYFYLSLLYTDIGEYSKAAVYGEESLDCNIRTLSPNNPLLATSYNNIGRVYSHIGEYSKALSSYERSLEIMKIALPPNHSSWASFYSNIGFIHDTMGEYSKAILSYERSLPIRQVALPPNHPSLATSYNNIGVVYSHMGEYSKALSSFERGLEIRQAALPPNHPDLANSYNNIGVVYSHTGEYSKAILSFERGLEIRQAARPPNHPDLANSYNNIGSVYSHVGEYPKALSSYERSLEIMKIALSPNHSDLATSYNNIGVVYSHMGEYSKALSSYERGLEIRKVALPPNHPELATSYNNIGSVYSDMGEYQKAISSYERCLEIQKVALPPNHPDLAISYNNFGVVYSHMGQYCTGLHFFEEAEEIFVSSLPATHPNVVAVRDSINIIKRKMK